MKAFATNIALIFIVTSSCLATFCMPNNRPNKQGGSHPTICDPSIKALERELAICQNNSNRLQEYIGTTKKQLANSLMECRKEVRSTEIEIMYMTERLEDYRLQLNIIQGEKNGK